MRQNNTGRSAQDYYRHCWWFSVGTRLGVGTSIGDGIGGENIGKNISIGIGGAVGVGTGVGREFENIGTGRSAHSA